jgi:hypothetical protein
VVLGDDEVVLVIGTEVDEAAEAGLGSVVGVGEAIDETAVVYNYLAYFQKW